MLFGASLATLLAGAESVVLALAISVNKSSEGVALDSAVVDSVVAGVESVALSEVLNFSINPHDESNNDKKITNLALLFFNGNSLLQIPPYRIEDIS
jgi:phosphoribosylformylglycinamidine (FGAM) synthase PurS component